MTFVKLPVVPLYWHFPRTIKGYGKKLTSCSCSMAIGCFPPGEPSQTHQTHTGEPDSEPYCHINHKYHVTLLKPNRISSVHCR